MLTAKKTWLILILSLASVSISAQETRARQIAQPEQMQQVSRESLRPSVQAYLDYLKQELTVTDAPESRREVNPAFIRHNFNRVSALRQFALKLAAETDTDFMPEMEAVTSREFHLLFLDKRPAISELKAGEIYNLSYRFLGAVKNEETFYIFARLDPYEEENVRREAKKLLPAETEKPSLNENNNGATENKTTEKTAEKPANGDTESTEKSEPQTEKPGGTITRERFLKDLTKAKAPVSPVNPPQ